MSNESFLDADLNELLRKGYAELEKALEQEDVAERQLAFCQSRVARLTEKIIQLAIASDDRTLIDAVKETGLTDVIRNVLRAADKPLTAPEIRKRLEEIGYDVSAYQNFLATLYLTLQRLQKQKEVYEIKHLGKKVYLWQFGGTENSFRKALTRHWKVPEEPKTLLRVPEEPKIFVNLGDPEEVEKLKKS